MASDYVGVRITDELRAAISAICADSGITLSEWIRTACVNALTNGQGYGGVAEGYVQGRKMGLALARYVLNQASDLLPATYEEAAVMFGQPGPGRPANEDDY